MIENFISHHIQKHPLHHLLSYALFPMGKMLRSSWMKKVAHEENYIISHAAAIECIHTYSLIHDDLPCMDHGMKRRGKNSMWVHAGETNAVLIGDLLLSMAFEFIDDPVISKKTSKAAQDMVLGQYIDMNQNIETLDDVIELYRLKTGQLFGIAGWMAISEEFWFHTGEQIGICYQIIDDIKDVQKQYHDKDTSKDIHKKNIIDFCGVEGAQKYMNTIKESLPDVGRHFLDEILAL